LVFAKNFFDDVFVLFCLQGTGGINQAAVGSEVRERRAQDGNLPAMEFRQVFWSQAPLDFGITRERAGAGAGDVGQDAVIGTVERELAGIGDYGLYVSR
jgi:hypothetical protein